MFVLAKGLGEEAMDDPSLLHPLFSRLPPLYADTPDSPSSPDSNEDANVGDDGEPNPYSPIPLSRLFQLTDELMARFPWDGDIIRGREIMGEGSAVCTYDQEVKLRSEEMLGMMQKEVVKPGAGIMDEEEEEEVLDEVKKDIKRRRRVVLHMPRNRLGTAIALGVLVLGVELAMYGRGSNGRDGWARWWGVVLKSWVARLTVQGDVEGVVLNGYRKISGIISRIMRDYL